MKRNIPFDWRVFMQDPEFLRTVTFSPDHIDCHLSEKGRNEVLPSPISVLRPATNIKTSIPTSSLSLPCRELSKLVHSSSPTAKCPTLSSHC
jgi:hypothetical protein